MWRNFCSSLLTLDLSVKRKRDLKTSFVESFSFVFMFLLILMKFCNRSENRGFVIQFLSNFFKFQDIVPGPVFPVVWRSFLGRSGLPQQGTAGGTGCTVHTRQGTFIKQWGKDTYFEWGYFENGYFESKTISKN